MELRPKLAPVRSEVYVDVSNREGLEFRERVEKFSKAG